MHIYSYYHDYSAFKMWITITSHNVFLQESRDIFL